MEVVRFINSILKSNSYILCFENNDSAFVVDPGDSNPIIEWITENNKCLKGVLITHAHFDHIYGVNDLYDTYPDMAIYASEAAKEGMLSAKINRSYYTENPFSIKCKKINILEESKTVYLAENIFANVLYTPGHNNDCISFEIESHLFTGDALIPGFKVFTKTKFGNKLLAKESINKIFNTFDSQTLICPGHGDMFHLEELVNSMKY
jgi:glyoxylase-like metal-dependent hydrolase (beta-lactamase superfamily II)